MIVQRSILVFTAMWLGACIAGPTPHPAIDAGSEPFLSGEPDAAANPEDNASGQADAPSADVMAPSDSGSDTVVPDDSSGSIDTEGSSSEDAVMNDGGGAHSGPVDAG